MQTFALFILIICCFTGIEGTNVNESSLLNFKPHVIVREKSDSKWPGNLITSTHPNATDRESFDKWLMNTRPYAFMDWINCTAPLSRKTAVMRLGKLKKAFENSVSVEDLVTWSNCAKSEFMALFETTATAPEAMNAFSCIKKAVEQPVARFAVAVRVDEDCEREKRNMINRWENLLSVAILAVAGTGTYCAIPLSAAGWCGPFGASLISEAIAIAELQSAREFECPKCSDGPTARMITVQNGYPVSMLFWSTGSSDRRHDL